MFSREFMDKMRCACPYFLGYNLLAYKSLKVICDSKLEI